MPARSLAIFSAVLVSAWSSGCGCPRPDQVEPPATQAAPDWRGTFYRFDDPRCSADQQRAVRAATKAVTGTDQPSANLAEYLHFSCHESEDDWSVQVWHFGPNEGPVPGGFTSVLLNRDFSLRSVMGGA
jgi:hypothetical protein